jgi:hypothetical protein
MRPIVAWYSVNCKIIPIASVGPIKV